jgi:hypothetical protein
LKKEVSVEAIVDFWEEVLPSYHRSINRDVMKVMDIKEQREVNNLGTPGANCER